MVEDFESEQMERKNSDNRTTGSSEAGQVSLKGYRVIEKYSMKLTFIYLINVITLIYIYHSYLNISFPVC